MAKGASRQGKDSAGGVIIAGSGNVFVNGSPQVRVGDAVSGHGGGKHASPVMISGSGNVFVNGISACREGDPATCDDTSSGSSNVFIN
jgi:uncharacterized Zn-binding protein involved in type VI secretion